MQLSRRHAIDRHACQGMPVDAVCANQCILHHTHGSYNTWHFCSLIPRAVPFPYDSSASLVFSTAAGTVPMTLAAAEELKSLARSITTAGLISKIEASMRFDTQLKRVAGTRHTGSGQAESGLDHVEHHTQAVALHSSTCPQRCRLAVGLRVSQLHRHGRIHVSDHKSAETDAAAAGLPNRYLWRRRVWPQRQRWQVRHRW